MAKKKKRDAPWTPFVEVPMPDYPAFNSDTCWLNSRYQVYMRLTQVDAEPCVHLSIKRCDRREIRDWRDMQRIKNELVDAEAEGVELYPAESRLVDTANQYHLWVFFSKLPFGFDQGRFVSETNVYAARQRQWDADVRPSDLRSSDEVRRRLDDFFGRIISTRGGQREAKLQDQSGDVSGRARDDSR